MYLNMQILFDLCFIIVIIRNCHLGVKRLFKVHIRFKHIRISVEENLAKEEEKDARYPQMIIYAIFMSVIRMARPQVYHYTYFG